VNAPEDRSRGASDPRLGDDSAHSGPLRAELRTFLIADIRGYTRFTQTRGDEAAGLLAARFSEFVRSGVESRDGTLLELRGDEALVVFTSARQALRAAVELQQHFAVETRADPSLPLGVGIGIDAGEAVPVSGGYRGGALNLAARLCARAGPGEILASETVVQLAGHVEGIRAIEPESLRLKGLRKPVRAFRIVSDHDGRRMGVGRRVRRSVRRVRRPRLVLGVVGACALAAAAAAAFGLGRGGSGSAPALVSVPPDSLAVVDPKRSRVTGEVPIPGGPSLVAAGPRVVWVASDASRTISSVSADRRAVTHVVAPNATPTAFAADGDAVWVLDGSRRVLLKVDPTYGAVTRRIRLPRAPPAPVTNQRLSSLSLAAGEGALWVTDGSTRLLRVDPESGQVVKAVDAGEPLNDVAVGHGSVWAISGRAATVFQIDPRGNAVETRIRIVNRGSATAPFPVAVAVGEGAVWVVNGNTQTVSRVDPEFGGVSATIPLGIGANPNDIAAGAGAVWAANGGNGTLARIDPATNSVAVIALGSSPAGVAIGGGRVWVTLQPGFRTSVSAPSSAVSSLGSRSLPASVCSGVEFEGKGQPTYLIASDLPLQGQDSLAETLQQSDAIRFVLAKHHFRAGKYSVGYQSCDDSISQTGVYDERRCRANAQAFAAHTSVIGIVGGYNSGCVRAQLAVLAAARGGPLAMVSGNATYVGLTHAGPGTAQGEPEKYYPKGARDFVRVVVADDLQGAADALLAKRLGVRRLYVLHDADPYGFGIASNVRHVATKLGIPVAGFEQWDPHARTYTAIAHRVQRTRADAVFLGGSIDISNGAVLVKSLRSVLGDRVHILTPDGFTPISAFAKLAGPAAEGVTVSFPAAPPQRLQGEGRRFVAEFGKAVGRPVEAYSAAWAQATEVLLAAIASSDGSRTSVTSNLFTTKVSNGILGNFSFDRNGDTTAGAVTIYRIVGGSPRVQSVITPPSSLLK
jgi:branched-chain amino acid transport system substrate-binding protein